MNILPTSLKGLLIIEPNVFEDKRGYFLETYHYERFQLLFVVEGYVRQIF